MFRRDPMRKYLVREPWHIRLQDFYWKRIHCPVFGHKHQHKLSCVICEHCRIVLRTR